MNVGRAEKLRQQIEVQNALGNFVPDELEDRLNKLSFDPLFVRDLAVTGDDVIEAHGKPGPHVGRALNHLLEVVIKDPKENVRESLLSHLQETLKP